MSQLPGDIRLKIVQMAHLAWVRDMKARAVPIKYGGARVNWALGYFFPRITLFLI